ncbi:MAG: copper resistance protein B [Allosphingosinicella sp.]|uniref:copper resistance protein B n=1 Tax=Allosphingosinicella sp. TaxID=2823234 RepID=UPI003941F3E9
MSALLALLLAAAQPHDPHADHAQHGQHDHHQDHRDHQDHQDHQDHSGHGDHAHHGAAPGPAGPPVAPPPPGAFGGPAHAADALFGAERMAPVREQIRREHGGMAHSRLLVDRLEARLGGHDGYAWDAQFWWGGDLDKLWLKSEGEGGFGGGPEHAEVQALYSRAIDPWFDLQAGVRQDLRPGPNRTHAVLGLHGLAPYWFEVEAMLFLSTRGELSARAEAEYDLRLTRRLVLQPSLELDVSFQDVPELGLGSGLSGAEAGARLRYEIAPNLAPYIGVEYARAFGGTARYRRAAGEDAGGWSALVGIRAWF